MTKSDIIYALSTLGKLKEIYKGTVIETQIDNKVLELLKIII